MKLVTYKLKPFIKRLYCDCGEKMREDNNVAVLLTASLVNIPFEYKYKCTKCGKEYISKEDLNINQVQYEVSEVIEEKEIKEDEES